MNQKSSNPLVYRCLPPALRLVLFACLCLSTGLWGADASETLRKAWREYDFQSYRKADDLFQQALQEATSPAERQQARIGMAMVLQFDERQNDLPAAVTIYRSLLGEGIEGQPGLLVKSLLGEALVDVGQTEEGVALWDEVIAAAPESMVAQDALMQRSLLQMSKFGSEQSLETARKIERLQAENGEPDPARPLLDPMLSTLATDIYFYHGDMEKALEHIRRVTDFSSTETASYSNYATMLFRGARICELALGDTEQAGQFYRKLVEETPNDVRCFFALERAAAYGAFTPQEVRDLDLYGVNETVITEIFNQKEPAPVDSAKPAGKEASR